MLLFSGVLFIGKTPKKLKNQTSLIVKIQDCWLKGLNSITFCCMRWTKIIEKEADFIRKSKQPVKMLQKKKETGDSEDLEDQLFI